MQLTKGDPVELRLGPDEYVSGEVVDTDYTDIFSDGWTILALVSEGGHPTTDRSARSARPMSPTRRNWLDRFADHSGRARRHSTVDRAGNGPTQRP